MNVYAKDAVLTVLVFGVLLHAGGTRLVDVTILGLILGVFLVIPMIGAAHNWFDPFDE